MMSHSREDRSSRAAACSSVTLIFIIATCTVILDAPIQFAQSVGLGDKAIWREGALLAEEIETEDEHSEVNTLFERPVESHEEPNEPSQEHVDQLYVRYVDLVRRWPIDVVEARRDLTRLMQVVSTKSRAHFLTEHDDYYSQLKVGTTNRPMLLAYLGLRLSGREHMRAWLDRAVRGPASASLASSCMSLLETRNKRAPSGNSKEADQKLLEDLRELQPKRNQAYRFHLAHLTFENNMNLFMLENFLILCSKLDELVPEKVKMPGFSLQYKPLF